MTAVLEEVADFFFPDTELLVTAGAI